MRAIKNQQVITLFGGECISPSFRGRRRTPPITKQKGRRVAVLVGALLIGFASAATAITETRHPAMTDDFSQGSPANLMVAPRSLGFETAIY
jgi:hypothetical protein